MLMASSCRFCNFLSTKTAIRSRLDIFSSSCTLGTENKVSSNIDQITLELWKNAKNPKNLTWTNLGLVNFLSCSISSPPPSTSSSTTIGRSSSTWQRDIGKGEFRSNDTNTLRAQLQPSIWKPNVGSGGPWGEAVYSRSTNPDKHCFSYIGRSSSWIADLAISWNISSAKQVTFARSRWMKWVLHH